MLFMQNTEKVTFSIVIATFNAAEHLQKTLDSVKNQCFKNFELIIIDGNSSDTTVDIIKANDEMSIRWVSEQDTGLYDAWNKAIKRSNGTWITFLGAGDILYPDALLSYSSHIETLAETPDYISAKIRRIDEKGRFISVLGEAWSWAQFKNSMTVAHVGSLHHQRLFSEIGLFDSSNYKICADYELLLRKKSKLKTSFLDKLMGEMPNGGVSFSVKALKESAKAKYKTGQGSFFTISVRFVFYWILLKTYRIRHL